MIRKALIPIAGLGKRMGPLARAVPKGMFPLVDGQDRVRPVLHVVLAEAFSAGITEAAIVVSPDHTEMLRRYFAAAARSGCRDLPPHIEYIVQTSPMGFGDAVARGAAFVGPDEAGFLLMLGDHVYIPAKDRPSCAAQVVEAFQAWGGAAMIGMQTVGPETLPQVGAAGGEPLKGNVYRCTAFIEKPDLAAARARLVSPGLGRDRFLAHCGIYVFTPEIFECLARLQVEDRPAGQEIQLSDAQAALLSRHGEDYYLVLVEGGAYDTGTPANYARAFEAFRGS